MLAERSFEVGSTTIGVHSHSVFVDRTRVRSTVATYHRFAYLHQLFGAWGIQQLTFQASLNKQELMSALRDPGQGEAHQSRGSGGEAAGSRGDRCPGGHKRGR